MDLGDGDKFQIRSYERGQEVVSGRKGEEQEGTEVRGKEQEESEIRRQDQGFKEIELEKTKLENSQLKICLEKIKKEKEFLKKSKDDILEDLKLSYKQLGSGSRNQSLDGRDGSQDFENQGRQDEDVEETRRSSFESSANRLENVQGSPVEHRTILSTSSGVLAKKIFVKPEFRTSVVSLLVGQSEELEETVLVCDKCHDILVGEAALKEHKQEHHCQVVAVTVTEAASSAETLEDEASISSSRNQGREEPASPGPRAPAQALPLECVLCGDTFPEDAGEEVLEEHLASRHKLEIETGGQQEVSEGASRGRGSRDRGKGSQKRKTSSSPESSTRDPRRKKVAQQDYSRILSRKETNTSASRRRSRSTMDCAMQVLEDEEGNEMMNVVALEQLLRNLLRHEDSWPFSRWLIGFFVCL